MRWLKKPMVPGPGKTFTEMKRLELAMRRVRGEMLKTHIDRKVDEIGELSSLCEC